MKFLVLKLKKKKQILLLELLKTIHRSTLESLRNKKYIIVISLFKVDFTIPFRNNNYAQQKHLKIYGSFEFRDTVSNLKNIP